VTTIRTATGLISWYMRACGFEGWTSFWRVIYVLPGHENNQRLLRHERKHLEQIEREGRLLFAIKYLYWLCRYGYQKYPYEVEAYKEQIANGASVLSCAVQLSNGYGLNLTQAESLKLLEA